MRRTDGHSVASGGSSTINGVVYQLLRSLLHVAKIRVHRVALESGETTVPRQLTVILEPRGGGGDLQVRGTDSLIVEQIKTRSDGSTWSLREVIEQVLPDLFLAVAQGDAEKTNRYRFVTEGRMGAWIGVY